MVCTVQYTLSVHPPFLSYRQSVHCNASDGSKVDWQAQYAIACNFQSFFARQSIFQRIHSWIIWLAGSKAKTSWDWLHKKAADDMVRYGRIHFWSLEITISRPPSRVRRYNPQLNLMLWSLPSGKVWDPTQMMVRCISCHHNLWPQTSSQTNATSATMPSLGQRNVWGLW